MTHKYLISLILLSIVIVAQCSYLHGKSSSSNEYKSSGRPRQQVREDISPPKPGVFMEELRCELDPKLTVENLKNDTKYLEQIKRYLWATACPRARGIFIIDGVKGYEGFTYSCANFPPAWGVSTPLDFFKTPDQYEQHLKYLRMYFEGIFNTTAEKRPNTCDFFGFSKLFCGEKYEQPWKKAPWYSKVGQKPLRGVNAGGLFVLEPWITPGFTQWKAGMDDQYTYSEQNKKGSSGYSALIHHWESWYNQTDFDTMKQYGLNAVRLPVGWWYWAREAGVGSDPYIIPDADIMSNLSHPITVFISRAKKAGLQVLLDLHGAPGSQNGLDNSGQRSNNSNPEMWGFNWIYSQDRLRETTKILLQIVKYVAFLEENGMDNIMGLELINEPWVFLDMSLVRDWYLYTIGQIRQLNPDIPLIVHDAFRHSEWQWLTTNWPWHNTFMDTHIYHAFNADDIASSNPSCDKLKQTIAENIACGYGSMLRFKTCTSLPTFVGEWSLAIDDCMGNIRGQSYSVQFHDFGQCKNLKARVGDEWWAKHVNSFASRQMAMAERELGWFFWTYKTGYGADKDPSNAYWSFKDAVKAKFITTPLKDEWIQPACNYIVEDGGKC